MSNLEENKDEVEVVVVSETSNYNDTNPETEAPKDAKESVEAPELNNEGKTDFKKKGKIITATAATAVVAIVSYSVISSSGLINLTMDAKINSITYTDTGIDYDIDVTDVKTSNVMYFDFLRDDASISKHNILENLTDTYTGNLTGHLDLSDIDFAKNFEESGKIEYTVRLCGDTGLLDRTYDSWILEVDGLSSKFNTVTYECDCVNSGCFLFTMDFVDNYGIFTEFVATLKDTSGHESKCTFTNNYHEQQKIPCNMIDGTGVTFTISVNESNETNEAGEKVYKVLYSELVEL